MARPEKVAAVTEIRERLEEADAAVLTEYRGLTVTEIAELRAALRPAGTDLKIFKNTLARRAATEAGAEDLVPMLEGPTAIAFVKGDAVLAAKALKAFAKTTEAFVVKGGLLGTRLITAAEVDALAEVAPREELLARIAGAFQAPLVKAAGLFQALPRNMAYGVKALIDQRIEAGETPPPAEAPAEEPAAEAPQTEEAPAAESTPAEPSGEATEETAEPAGDAAAEEPAAEADAEAPAAE